MGRRQKLEIKIPEEVIERRIIVIRGKKVMMDRHLAELYGVETGALNRAVKRNPGRFPADFMFRLTQTEFERLRCQFGISNQRGGIRYLPYLFTQEGVAMLSSVLNSERAIQVNVHIMRTFARFREMLSAHKTLKHRIEDMEEKYDRQFRIVFQAIKKLIEPPQKPKKQIGFHT